jgi:hypothetical protein
VGRPTDGAARRLAPFTSAIDSDYPAGSSLFGPELIRGQLMRAWSILLVALLTLGPSGAARAEDSGRRSAGGSGTCAFVRGSDWRAYCRAVTGGGAAQCSFIADTERQTLCRALTGGGSARCAMLQSSDLRPLCRALTGEGDTACAFVESEDLKSYCRAATQGQASRCASIQSAELRTVCRAHAGE